MNLENISVSFHVSESIPDLYDAYLSLSQLNKTVPSGGMKKITHLKHTYTDTHKYTNTHKHKNIDGFHFKILATTF